MNNMDYRKEAFWRLLLSAALLNVLAQAVHELGHWSVYQINGRAPVWGFTSLVQVWDEPPLHPAEWVETTSQSGGRGWLRLRSLPESPKEEFITAAAGPVASLIGVLVGLFIFYRSRRLASKQVSLIFALAGSFVMSMYYLRSGFRSGGDEAQMADILNISKSVLEITFALIFISCLILSFLVLKDWRTILKWMIAILLGSVPTGLMLMEADAIVRMQVNLGNPLFRPVVGFSFPVVLVYVLVLTGVFVLWSRPKRRHLTDDNELPDGVDDHKKE